jgi:NCS1 family nucleobase:cation symporter-1
VSHERLRRAVHDQAGPGSARHGSARDLLPFWLTVNASVYTIGLGAFMAAHSAQGPRLGVPQLVQSRAQFGFYGALLPNAAIWLLLLSTLVAADVTAGGTLAGCTTWPGRIAGHGGTPPL